MCSHPRLRALFSAPIPPPHPTLRTGHRSQFDGGASSTAEATSVQMEFWSLSQETQDPQFGVAAMGVLEHIRNLPKLNGLVPIFIE